MAVALGFLGVSLIAYPAITAAVRAGSLGVVLPLAAAAGVASESVLFKRLRVADERVQVAGWQLLTGGVVLALVSLRLEGTATIVWSGRFVILLAYLTVAGTALPTVLWYRVLQEDEVSRLSLLLFLIPVLGLVLAVAVFDEAVGPTETAGVIITIAALITVARGTRRRRVGEQPASHSEAPQTDEKPSTAG